MRGWYSGTGGAAGLTVRVEIEALSNPNPVTDPNQSGGQSAVLYVWSSATCGRRSPSRPLTATRSPHRYVWSSATSLFDHRGPIPVDLTIGEGGALAFGPELMVALKGTVVTGVKGTYYAAHNGIEIEIVVKIGFLPRMTIAAVLEKVRMPFRSVSGRRGSSGLHASRAHTASSADEPGSEAAAVEVAAEEPAAPPPGVVEGHPRRLKKGWRRLRGRR